jgi:peptidylprolyl isomerase
MPDGGISPPVPRARERRVGQGGRGCYVAAMSAAKSRKPSSRTGGGGGKKSTGNRRSPIVVIGAVVLVAALVLGAGIGAFAILANSSSDSSSVDAAGGSTSTLPTVPVDSAAGKPCVAVSDPLPTGAPAVPVEVGPPPSKLVVKDLAPGTGAPVTLKDTLTVNYIGVSCSTGKIFDSTYERGSTTEFPLAGVIPGWQQGLAGMNVGGTRLLGIPPDLAYGAAGQPPVIAPSETLWFVVNVVGAKPTA